LTYSRRKVANGVSPSASIIWNPSTVTDSAKGFTRTFSIVTLRPERMLSWLSATYRSRGGITKNPVSVNRVSAIEAARNSRRGQRRRGSFRRTT
jgi:hypothetical protein